MKIHCLSICVCGNDDQRYSIVCNVKKIFICLLISACHLTFTIIFHHHALMNTFIQWRKTISDTYLTDTLPCFPFIEPNISLLPQGSLASIPSNALIFACESPSLPELSYLNFFYFIIIFSSR